jgi:hypothetical protein
MSETFMGYVIDNKVDNWTEKRKAFTGFEMSMLRGLSTASFRSVEAG